jgi:hypothetical protein
MHRYLLPALAAAGAATASNQRREALSGVPDYVLQYAPMVYLYSQDVYFPSDLGAQLQHIQPQVKFKPVSGGPDILTLDNVNELNEFGNANVYLTSTDNPTTYPDWLGGVKPDDSGKTNGAKSCAIIVNDHGSGLVDVFYMYFYAFNWGGLYLDYMTIGNHVGDWEHNMVRYAIWKISGTCFTQALANPCTFDRRFQDGAPQAVWYSQHANGEAFMYSVVEKYSDGLRVSPALPQNHPIILTSR